jgi:transcriptional regulator with XRE-family HTH domain
MEATADALGQVIRSLREEQDPAMSQEELGKKAGYRGGAGVSISRVESGLTRPGPDRLAGIALALGITPEQLLDEAARFADRSNGGRHTGPEPTGGTSLGAKSGSRSSMKARLERVQETVDKRMTCVQELGEAFNKAHDGARDEFFLSFVEIADHITGAPPPPPPAGLTVEEDTEAAAGPAAPYRLNLASHGIAKAVAAGVGGAATGAGTGGAATYAAFTAAAMLGSASTRAAISGLAGATNVTLGLRGGTLAAGAAGFAGGTLLLTGLAAAPAALLMVGRLVFERRNRKQEAALLEKLEQAEAGIAGAQRGFDALVDVLPRATEILDYIAVHASHAFKKWRADLAPRPMAWPDMTPEQQRRYQDFITIAGCQLSVVTISFEEFMATDGEQLDRLIESANEVLTQAAKTVEALA